MTPLGARRLGLHRRDLLAATVSVLAFLSSAQAATLKGIPDWSPNGGSPPQPVRPGPWQFFSPEEGAVVEALVDRLIPPDPNTPGGKEAGCAVFIDRQLAGPYGEARGLYMRPPFQDGDPQQGYQSPLTPAMRYRRSLAALDKYCQASFAGKRFHELPPDQQDKLIAGLQSGTVKLENVSGRGFFELLLQNTQEGFFADPVYGGNRDFAGWRQVSFPGAQPVFTAADMQSREAFTRAPIVGLQSRADNTRRG